MSKIQGICILCNKNKQHNKGKSYGYRTTCQRCWRYRRLGKTKDICEICGFIPIHPCQMDVDHIDGNHYNNEVSNLQVLCANCHRLKTIMNGDHLQ